MSPSSINLITNCCLEIYIYIYIFHLVHFLSTIRSERYIRIYLYGMKQNKGLVKGAINAMPHHTASRGLSSPSAMTEAVIKVITVVRTPGKAIITEFTFIHCVPGSGERELMPYTWLVARNSAIFMQPRITVCMSSPCFFESFFALLLLFSSPTLSFSEKKKRETILRRKKRFFIVQG